jgi:hypothetical protein
VQQRLAVSDIVDQQRENPAGQKFAETGRSQSNPLSRGGESFMSRMGVKVKLALLILPFALFLACCSCARFRIQSSDSTDYGGGRY